MTHAQTQDLEQICRERNLPLDQRPDTLLLHELINTIIGDDMSDMPINRNLQECIADVHNNSSDPYDSSTSSSDTGWYIKFNMRNYNYKKKIDSASQSVY